MGNRLQVQRANTSPPIAGQTPRGQIRLESVFCYTGNMNNDKFNALLDEQLERCRNLLVKKNEEYATNTDRLSNFRQPSSLMRMHPAEVAFCYDAKHIASIQKIVHELSEGKVPSKEMWQEKITDYINYGLLMNACVMEAIEEQ